MDDLKIFGSVICVQFLLSTYRAQESPTAWSQEAYLPRHSLCAGWGEEVNPWSLVPGHFQDRVSTAPGNQGKLEGIFPVREKSENLAFLKKIREKSGKFDDTIFFYILMTQYIFMAVRGRITAGCCHTVIIRLTLCVSFSSVVYCIKHVRLVGVLTSSECLADRCLLLYNGLTQGQGHTVRHPLLFAFLSQIWLSLFTINIEGVCLFKYSIP